MSKFNDPFYLAIPRPAASGALRRAAMHVSAEFGVSGRAEVVRVEPGFVLCRIVGGAR